MASESTTMTYDYVRVDFSTLKEKFKEELQKESTFKDYDFEGSNINVLLDLLCYFSELGIYYVNKVAGEAFPDTAKLYENLHRLASMLGYTPRGWESASVSGYLALPGSAVGSLVSVYGEKEDAGFLTWSTGLTDDETGEEILYVMTRNYYGVVPSSGKIPITLTQGVVTEFDFTGKDIVNNKIIIPAPSFSLGYDTKWDEEHWKDIQDPSGIYYNESEASSGWQEEPIKVFVYEGTDEPGAQNKWLRVNDFQQECNTMKKYRWYLNKWKRYTIEFDQVRGLIPLEEQRIKVQVVRTLGNRGRVVSGSISLPTEVFVYNHTVNEYIANNLITGSFRSSSGGYEYESEENIRNQIPIHVASQNRCVTGPDYEAKLQERSDIFKATVWGESDKLTPDLNKMMYIYIAILPAYPDTFNSNYVETYIENGFEYISGYTSGWKQTLDNYLTPYKTINFHMEYTPVEVVHLWFDVLVKINKAAGIGSNYIKNTVNDKIKRFFKDASQISFNMMFKTYALQEYILSTDNNISEDEDNRINAIQYIVIRNVRASRQIYEPNSSELYPQWENSYLAYQNEMRNVKFGLAQIPIYNEDDTIIEVS